MNQKYFCIVGFGNHAQSKIIPAIKKTNGKIVGIVSGKSNLNNNYTFYSTLSKALLKVEPDTTFILCSPPDLHYLQTLEIIKNKHNVFVEKPVAISLLELKEIIKLSNEKKTFFVENFMYEYSKFYINFINFWNLEKNNIKKIDIKFTLPKLPVNTFRHKINNYPVNLYDIGCYAINLTNNLSNEAKYQISKIWNKGEIDNEKIILISKAHMAEVKITFGLDESYKNLVKVTTLNKQQFRFEPFFFGREGYRTLKEINQTKIIENTIYDQDCFKTMFEKSSKYWIDTQESRNKVMLNNLSSLENLSKQYNSI